MSIIEDYKLNNNLKTSEEIFDITIPPEHQCKKIDDIVGRAKTIHKISSKSERMDEDELKSALFDVNWESDGMEGDMEDIRKAIEDVRQWGQEWKDFAKELIENNQIDIGELV